VLALRMCEQKLMYLALLVIVSISLHLTQLSAVLNCMLFHGMQGSACV
jgi:hypothetical protein